MVLVLNLSIRAINLPASSRFYRLKTPTKQHFTPKFDIFKLPKPIFTAPSSIISSSSSTTTISTVFASSKNFHWIVTTDKPPSNIIHSKPQLINYYVTILLKALTSDGKNAQMHIYDASCDINNLGFCCFVDEQTSHLLAGVPGVLSVKPDPDVNCVHKDYSYNFSLEENSLSLQTVLLYPKGSKHWLVCVEKPSSRAFSKAQMVDFYVDMVTTILRNEKDAQMCLYHLSLQADYGFCCILDEDCAKELAAVPGVLSVQPDENFESENKDYGGGRLSPNSPTSVLTDMSKTKLFITGLSFYTSEKTLRAAFEPFGELIEVKIIMDKISKRSKGYAFVEFTSEDDASTALREMNGNIINGWMIVVDRARANAHLSRGSRGPFSY